jgi:dUTP pyrophosphatase
MAIAIRVYEVISGLPIIAREYLVSQVKTILNAHQQSGLSMEVKIKKLRPNTKFLVRDCGNGIDLFADLDSPILLYPGMRRLIPTGIAIQLPSNTEAQLRPKRGIAINCGVTILDAPHIIQEGDENEIQVLLINLGEKGFSVKPGAAIARMVIVPVYYPKIYFIEETEAIATENISDLLLESPPTVNTSLKVGTLSRY